MSEITNYQCPACTGPLHYSGQSGKLECEFCGSSYEVAAIEALYADKDKAAAEQTEKTAKNPSGWGDEGDDMRAYNCPSCGAEIFCDATTAATSCPYCGNNSIVPGQFDGTKKPDLIIPFKLDKEAAKAALKKHCKGRPFLPSSFKSDNHISEIKGVYVPFWLFDGVADVDARFEASNSQTRETRDERITTTQHYDVHRAGTVTFEKVPVDASTKMPDDHMDSIEPYDYSELKEFSTAYMPGFLADKYDVSIADSAPRADSRCKQAALDSMEATVTGYEMCSMESSSVELHRNKVRYAMMPVWMLNTKWNGKDFLFAMNGQTGKFVGDLPVSWGKFWATFAAIFVPIAAILSLIMFG